MEEISNHSKNHPCEKSRQTSKKFTVHRQGFCTARLCWTPSYVPWFRLALLLFSCQFPSIITYLQASRSPSDTLDLLRLSLWSGLLRSPKPTSYCNVSTKDSCVVVRSHSKRSYLLKENSQSRVSSESAYSSS